MITRIARSGSLYFLLVFSAGFVLGIIRTIWAVPTFGTMTAELIETPLMLVAIVLSARWIVRRAPGQRSWVTMLGIGIFALFLLIVAEITVVLAIRGVTLAGDLAGRDPISGTVYAIMLGVFAIMPLLVAKTRARPGAS